MSGGAQGDDLGGFGRKVTGFKIKIPLKHILKPAKRIV